MEYIPPYLTDTNFLAKLDQERLKTLYIKIILLDWSERAVEEIQGYVTSGSISVNGDSAVRRTVSLTAILDNEKYNLLDIRFKFALNKKIKIYRGVKNTTREYTDFDTFWFPLGTYVLTGISASQSTTDISFSITATDKMCLLNGSVAGTIPAAVTFDKYDTLDSNGEWITVPIPYYNMIQEIVNHWGGEQLANIVIEDVPLKIRQVMCWGKEDYPVYIRQTKSGKSDISLKRSNGYTKYNYREDIGYIWTDFVYAGGGDISCSAGASAASVLDTIVSNLGGNFEYYYDVYGVFHFREKRNYLNTSLATKAIEDLDSSDYIIDLHRNTALYDFKDSSLIQSYSNSPQYSMIKNDFVVWGKTGDTNQFNTRYRLAIDTKPFIDETETYKVIIVPQTENGITYKYAYAPAPYATRNLFPKVGEDGKYYLATSSNKVYFYHNSRYTETTYKVQSIRPKDWRSKLYLEGVVAEVLATTPNEYYVDLKNEWPKICDVTTGLYFNPTRGDFSSSEYPRTAAYFLDFIDTNAAISQFSVNSIGRRQMVYSDESINCLFEREVPSIIFIDRDAEDAEEQKQEALNNGYSYCFIDVKWLNEDSSDYRIIIGGTSNPAYDTIRNLLYQYTNYNEAISLSTIPIYYLEPNTRIAVNNAEIGIAGEYVINSYSLPLDSSGSMNISATKALTRL